MTKFEELHSLAVACSGSFARYRAEVEAYARSMVRDFATYLSSPQGSFKFYRVNRQHEITQETDEPRPIFFFDTHWYFSLEISFLPEPGTTGYRFLMSIGLRRIGNEWTVRLVDKDFLVADGGPLGEVFDYLYDSMKADLQRDWTQPKRSTFGFRAPGQ